jgi:hypothetical protein
VEVPFWRPTDIDVTLFSGRLAIRFSIWLVMP